MAVPSFSAPASWRGTHPRATDQRASKHHGSRRFAFDACRPYAAACSGFAAIWCAANVATSFDLSDNLGIVFYGALGTLAAGAAAYWGLRAWWPDLDAEKEAEEARKAEERREHQRRWSAAAERVEHLKAERARLQKAKKSYAHVQQELSALTHAMLRGEV